jgi:hypothetical protein
VFDLYLKSSGVTSEPSQAKKIMKLGKNAEQMERQIRQLDPGREKPCIAGRTEESPKLSPHEHLLLATRLENPLA